MRSCQLKFGRAFYLFLEDGDSFFKEMEKFCFENEIENAFVPSFLAGFKTAKLVGTTKEVEDSKAPVWDHTFVENVEVVGTGTISRDETGKFSPHIHVSVGEKMRGGRAYTSHLLDATVIFLAEIPVIEVLEPRLLRVQDKRLYDVPLLGVYDQ